MTRGNGDAISLTDDLRVTEAVPAFVTIQRPADRLPGRAPDIVAVADVKITAIGVERHIVVAVSRQTPELCVAVKRISTAGIGNDSKKFLAAQVVEPWQRR